MTDKTVGIVIPTLNEEENIGLLLNDLIKQSKKIYKIYVVDGKSTDKTQKIVRKFKNVNFLKSKRGVGHQRHFGAKNIDTDILIFLDADTRIKSDFIEKTLIYFKKHNLDIACAYYLPNSRHIPIWTIYIFFNLLFFIFQKIKPSGAGSFIAVTKDHYHKVGGFESKYTYDDIHFIRKASKNGKFMVMPLFVFVSDRRFRKDGIIKTTFLYLYLSFYFLFNAFEKANNVKYKFGHYNPQNKKL